MNTERYQRQLVLPEFGLVGQQKLGKAKIAVVGAGGLGVPVLQYLVGMGVGEISLIDGDVIALSNLQRQVLYRTDDVGKRKVDVAMEQLSKLNPEVVINAIPEMLDQTNANEFFQGHDLVVDCTDSIEARYLINDTCVALNLPFIYGALYKFEGHVGVFNYKGSSTYRDVYPDDSAKVDNCNEIGVLGVLPGIIGCYQAMEAIKVVTGAGKILAGKLLVINALDSEHSTFTLGSQPDLIDLESTIDEDLLTWTQLENLKLEEYQLIDVRNEKEFRASHDERFKNIPTQSLSRFIPNGKRKLVLVCNRGIATRQASALIKSTHPDLEVYQIKGGYSSK